MIKAHGFNVDMECVKSDKTKHHTTTMEDHKVGDKIRLSI